MALLAKQPQSIGKVLDSGFKLYTSTFLQTLPLSFLAVVVPLVIVIALVGLDGYLQITATQLPPDASHLIRMMAVVGTATSIAMIFAFAFYTAIYYRLVAVALGRTLTFAAAVTAGTKALLPLLLASVLYSLAVSIGFILLIIPGVYLMISLVLYTPAYVMDRRGIIDSLNKSHKLVTGNWWRSLAVLSVPVLVAIALFGGTGAITGGAAALGAAAAGEGKASMFFLLLQLSQYIIEIFMVPMFSAFMIVLYHDLKLRKEGGDLRARINAGDGQ